ncbi:protocatechuate 3,4-dioxygenase subunit beta [Cupriavidus sp. USMAA2-4]|uniref:Protocatechuate 3,4-dioxygenase subunit beta n=1 Tax=Cupriavidus malaysiensis TaxID=367825 RepID=A0ABM6FA45_9BURK|nr:MULTISPECIES: protocatechuate 3,4-dioxygenase subunit beta [Cupriavidus]AOY95396.1 protocatechuate 3,4-dioxygenase subunit beta [Cupriavidus sp. USMAA2-4]AOZ01683.1 protocatechuate 3,4-dioxygenase subunit beta [Cupriavidus sp. USMAHM13]AOZ08567.1 protocatechuate 3,4-dioxygenase subunit beta [Cupriavidus malaysiensis]
MEDVLGYRRPAAGTQPDYLFPRYVATQKRSPKVPLVLLPQTLSEITGPVFGHQDLGAHDNDLTSQHDGRPLGERIIVSGRVLDENGSAVPNTLVEIWQANAAGRYPHRADRHDAPLDPNFTGCGRTLTDARGCYRFLTIRPGEYPWRNHYNGWRPAHIHFSVFGPAFATRLVTQMYFPGDPLLDYDPMYLCVPDAKARQRLVSRLDWEHTVPEFALAYRFDIVLRGREQTPWEPSGGWVRR